MQADSKKTTAMLDWPIPKTIKSLRGFLGLIGYYRKFIRNYGIIAVPLANLLKNDAFEMNEKPDLAFHNLKEIVSHPLVLALPDFPQPFLLECDASGYGIGAVLMKAS